jgi:hypothetical protein
MPAPMTMIASVALKLPGAMQLMQVPTIADASYTVRPSSEKMLVSLGGPGTAGVNPLSCWGRRQADLVSELPSAPLACDDYGADAAHFQNPIPT